MEKIKKIYKSDNFPLFIYIVFIAIIHIFMTKESDDIFFSTICSNSNISLFEFLRQRYILWTSRIIIEGVLVTFCQFLPMIIWKVVNIGMFYLLIHSISEIFVDKEKRKYNALICIVLLAIPFDIFKEAGWMATMNNYLWVGAIGLYSISVFKKFMKNEKVSIWQKIFFVLATIYASNQEQMAGILFIIYTVIGGLYIIKNKKCNPIIIINYIIIILQMLLVFICPGNLNRKISEETTWFPGFSDLSIIEKGKIGIITMMDYCIDSGRVVFFALIILIAYIIWKKYQNNFYRLIGCAPLILVIMFKYAMRILNEPEHIYLIQNSNLFNWAKCAYYVVILGLIGIELFIIFKDDKNKLITAILVYFVGFISRFIIALSPTIYASGERTALFWYISILVLIILNIQQINKEKEKVKNGKI